MIIHGIAIYQLLMELINTGRFVDASLEALELPRGAEHTLLVYSNERGSWR